MKIKHVINQMIGRWLLFLMDDESFYVFFCSSSSIEIRERGRREISTSIWVHIAKKNAYWCMHVSVRLVFPVYATPVAENNVHTLITHASFEISETNQDF